MLHLSDNLTLPSKVEAQVSTRRDLVTLMNNCLTFLTETLNQGAGLMASNPYGLTLEEARAALGTDIAEVDRLYALLQWTLNRASPGTVPNAPVEPPGPPTVIAVEKTHAENVMLSYEEMVKADEAAKGTPQ
jgi:hypothetical protein